MWRLMMLALLIGAVWGASYLLPPGNDEEQLRSVTGIATDTRATAPPAKPAVLSTAKAQLAPAAVTMAVTDSSAAGADTTELVLKLQQQLRRVGCYKGPIDGKWSAATRRAMARFDERIDVKVALDVPPPKLLAFVHSYVDRACGTPCPLGEKPDDQGSCMRPQVTASAESGALGAASATTPSGGATQRPASAGSKMDRLASVSPAPETAHAVSLPAPSIATIAATPAMRFAKDSHANGADASSGAMSQTTGLARLSTAAAAAAGPQPDALLAGLAPSSPTAAAAPPAAAMLALPDAKLTQVASVAGDVSPAATPAEQPAAPAKRRRARKGNGSRQYAQNGTYSGYGSRHHSGAPGFFTSAFGYSGGGSGGTAFGEPLSIVLSKH